MPKERAIISSVSIKIEKNGAKIRVSGKIMKAIPKLANLGIDCGFGILLLLFFFTVAV